MVRDGYKHTDVGVIPDDWDVRHCPEICWFQEGPGLRKWQFKSQGIKVVNVTNLQDSGHLNLAKTSRHITWEEFNSMYQHFEIDELDILIASSGNSYGKLSIARKRDLPLVMNTSVIRFKPKGDTTREYLWHFLKSMKFKEQIDLMITGGAQPNFGPVHLKQVLVPYPNKNEQKAIAKALSDVDALIESLEKLIAKKLAIKTATMQELLTGKTRLPGFDGEWKESTFAEIFQFGSTATNSRADLTMRGSTLYFHYGDLHTKFKNWFDVTSTVIPKVPRHLCSNATTVLNGDWVMADASEDIEGIGSAIEVRGLQNGQDAVAGLHTFLLRDKKGTFADGFKAYLGNSEQLKKQYRRVMTGMKVFGVSKTALKELVLPVPPKDEQAAIVTVLSVMDDSITTLSERLKQTENLKQGMMQELLTGRTRLV